MSFYVEYEYLCLPKMNTHQAVIMSGKKKNTNNKRQSPKRLKLSIPIFDSSLIDQM
jgi:hypothetical protein